MRRHPELTGWREAPAIDDLDLIRADAYRNGYYRGGPALGADTPVNSSHPAVGFSLLIQLERHVILARFGADLLYFIHRQIFSARLVAYTQHFIHE